MGNILFHVKSLREQMRDSKITKKSSRRREEKRMNSGFKRGVAIGDLDTHKWSPRKSRMKNTGIIAEWGELEQLWFTKDVILLDSDGHLAMKAFA
jgi:hypothetical protein